MNSIGLDRKYLVERFVYISNATLMDIERSAILHTKATDTSDIIESRIAQAIAREEDRQIQAGIRETVERNMEYNNAKDAKRKGFRLIQGGKFEDRRAKEGERNE